jgi:hypothetical protein
VGAERGRANGPQRPTTCVGMGARVLQQKQQAPDLGKAFEHGSGVMQLPWVPLFVKPFISFEVRGRRTMRPLRDTCRFRI